MTDPKESVFTLDQLQQLLAIPDQSTVLVGGQALAYWADGYGVSPPPGQLVEGISRDADFLGDRNTVSQLAKGVKGKPSYPSRDAITALVGQVTIPLSESEFLNVDVIHRLVGIDAGEVQRRALRVHLGDVQFWVMHPLDVLQSRVENLARLADKQTPEGVAQADLAVRVARSYVEIASQQTNGQRLAMKAIEHIVRIAKSGSGRKVSKEFGVDFHDAIPAHVVENEHFKTVRWPQIVAELAPPSKRPPPVC